VRHVDSPVARAFHHKSARAPRVSYARCCGARELTYSDMLQKARAGALTVARHRAKYARGIVGSSAWAGGLRATSSRSTCDQATHAPADEDRATSHRALLNERSRPSCARPRRAHLRRRSVGKRLAVHGHGALSARPRSMLDARAPCLKPNGDYVLQPAQASPKPPNGHS